jgi:hypothetical protein
MRRASKRADVDASIMLAESQIKQTELQERALCGFVNAEAKAQANREAIAEKALPLLSSNAPVDGIGDDWMANFFEKCHHMTDEQMQGLWGAGAGWRGE